MLIRQTNASILDGDGRVLPTWEGVGKKKKEAELHVLICCVVAGEKAHRRHSRFWILLLVFGYAGFIMEYNFLGWGIAPWLYLSDDLLSDLLRIPTLFERLIYAWYAWGWHHFYCEWDIYTVFYSSSALSSQEPVLIVSIERLLCNGTYKLILPLSDHLLHRDLIYIVTGTRWLLHDKVKWGKRRESLFPRAVSTRPLHPKKLRQSSCPLNPSIPRNT